MPRPLVSLIAAVARDGGIGHGGDLLVRLPGDLPRFKRITMGAPIVMGRKTWDSIGRALPGRTNIVVTRDRGFRAPGAETAASLDEALDRAAAAPRVYVIGGAADLRARPAARRRAAADRDRRRVRRPTPSFRPWDRRRFAQTAREPHQSADGVRYAFTTYKKLTQGD